VAGIVGGNGWSSADAGAPRLHWRGVAPKVLFINRSISNIDGDEGDVNNHSHIIGFNGIYNGEDYSVDNELWPHQRLTGNHPNPSHVVIYAAANQGSWFRQHSNQIGYYSILAEAKNPTVVGSINKDDTVRSIFSSMGPTRDGRLKPDIMAPGAESSTYPPRNHRYPTHVEFDYIRIRDSTGAIKFSWEFNTSAEGWDHDAGKSLCCDWGGLERSNISTPQKIGSVIRFDVYTLDLSYMWSDSIQQAVIMGSKDTLDMRYRIIFSNPSDYSFAHYMQGAVFWKTRNLASDVAGSNPILYRFGDSNFVTLRQPMQGWNDGDSLLALRFDFLGDTSALGINSSNLISLVSPQPLYHKLAGTSQAAPHVTGIAALMMQKYNRNYLQPRGKPLHRGDFWNSSVRSILVHTAVDLVHNAGPRDYENPDLFMHDPAHGTGVNALPGPDYATGYGMVNAQKAIAFVDTNNFKQDSVDNAQEIVYSFNLPSSVKSLRVSLAWDDLPGNPNAPIESPKLVNDLDLEVIDPLGNLYRPWVLNPLPQSLPFNPIQGRTVTPDDGFDPIDSASIRPAGKGVNSLDNLEVVDVKSSNNLPTNKWKIRVKGTRVTLGAQHFSLVSDFGLTRDSLVFLPSNLLFRFDVGSQITSSTALRTSDSSVFFAAGLNGGTLYAFSMSAKVVRWTFAPRGTIAITDPVLAGNRIYLVSGDSLFCIRDDGNHATVVWGKKLQPFDVAGHGNIGDTTTTYSCNQTFSPAIDITHNRLYTSTALYMLRTVLVNGTNGNPPWDSSIAVSTDYKLWTFDLDGNLIGQTFSNTPIAAPASASSDGAFFVDADGRMYKVHQQGYLLGSVRYLPANGRVNRQVVIGPNRKAYVQNDSIIVAIDQLTGDSLACFKSQDMILSNFVIDGNDNIHLIGYQRQPSSTTRYIVYDATGTPLIEATLGTGLRAAGELSLGADNLAYFVLDRDIYELDYYSAPPLEASRKFLSIADPGRSANIGSRFAIFASSSSLIAYQVTSDGLSDGWARSLKDNANTSFQNLTTPGFTPFPVGSSSSITTSTWNSSKSIYSLCGSSSGMGGTTDNLALAYSYTSGNFEYTARINGLNASHPSAKAGLVARVNTGNNAINGFIWISGSNTAGFSKRTALGGPTTTWDGLGTFVPRNAWVKLRRIGQTLYGFISQNGLHYTKLGALNIGSGSLYVGLAQTTGTLAKSGCADFSSVSTGLANPQALFVVGDTTLSGIDSAIRTRLVNLGYQVVLKSGLASKASDADFKDLVVISSTVTSADVGTKFRNVEVPVLNWEASLSDDLGMTGNVTGTDLGTVSGQSIQIQDPTHPLAAGKSGTVSVYVSTNTLSWGKANANAANVASVTGDANKSVLYAYEQGTGMVGLRAPARRVGFFLENAAGIQLNTNGQALFDSAVQWAVGPITPKALFVVGNTTLNGGDQVVYNNLVGKGYAVTVKSGPSAQTGDANGKNLVAVSSTIASADVGNKYTGVDVPVLNWESLLSDDLGMTGQGTLQGTASSQTQIKIVNSSLAAAARLSGTVKATTSSQTMTWGKPNANAFIVASLVSDTSAKTSFGYERGTTMVSGFAPARRFEIFLTDATASALSDSGSALLNASVAWSTGGQASSTQIQSVVGMENIQSWSSGDAILSLSTNRTEGNSSLQVDGGGYMLMTSSQMLTVDITGETSTMKLDVFVPGNQPNPSWLGAVQLYAECPSAGAYNVFMGQVELTGLPQNRYSTISFTVPTSVLNIMRGNYSDFVFKIALNVNEGTPPTLFDNLRFFP
jgi:hypothetical protein